MILCGTKIKELEDRVRAIEIMTQNALYTIKDSAADLRRFDNKLVQLHSEMQSFRDLAMKIYKRQKGE